MNRKILLTGKNGQVGWELERTLSTLGQVIALDQADMDLADPDSIRKVIRAIKPGLIVNPAAYTAVDKAESEPELTLSINGTAPGIMAEEAKRLDAALIHFSTDYVFDGATTTAYTEQDAPNPKSVYGSSKLAGELAIQAVGVPHLILRTSWVYGVRGKNFLLTMQRLARERPSLNVVDDQFGAPTWCRLLAEATAQIVAQGQGDVAGHIQQRTGVYHMTCAGQTSWHGFARSILERETGPVADLRPIPSMDYPTPAARPHYSVLDNARLADTFGIKLPDWAAALEIALA
ncbi:MAG: dTDP-4-dehydrorhamnose reductase [Gammaproteobacteria bacterium]